MLGLAARLPDSLVRVAPDLDRALGLRLHDRPQPAWQPLAVSRVEEDRVENSAEDVVLTIRTGRAPEYPVSSSRVDSVRSRRPSMPYMIWSEPSSVGSRSATNSMNSVASQSRLR